MRGRTDTSLGGFFKDTDCAVCGANFSSGLPAFRTHGVLASDLSVLAQSDPRTRIAIMILMRAREQGHFAVNGVESFWNQFEDELCVHCKAKLQSIRSSKSEAVRLLEKAASLSPGNKNVTNNLEALKKMV